MALGRKTGGRVKGTPNKATAALRKFAQQFDTEMILALRNIARNTRADADGQVQPAQYDDRARVVAARTVLEFGHGKPPVAIGEVDDDGHVVPSAVTFVIKKAESAHKPGKH